MPDEYPARSRTETSKSLFIEHRSVSLLPICFAQTSPQRKRPQGLLTLTNQLMILIEKWKWTFPRTEITQMADDTFRL